VKGQIERAEQFISQGINAAEQTQNELLLVEGSLLRAELLYNRKQLNETCSLLDKSEEIASSNRYRLHLLRIQCLKILCTFATSGVCEGQATLKELLGKARDFNAKREEAYILRALIELAQVDMDNNSVSDLLGQLLDLKVLMKDGDCATLIYQFQSYFKTEIEMKDWLVKAEKVKMIITPESLTMDPCGEGGVY
jgi:hypothetical protein